MKQRSAFNKRNLETELVCFCKIRNQKFNFFALVYFMCSKIEIIETNLDLARNGPVLKI